MADTATRANKRDSHTIYDFRIGKLKSHEIKKYGG